MWKWLRSVGWEKITSVIIFLVWTFISLVSINHLYRFSDSLVFSSRLLGILGWGAVSLSLIALSLRFWRQTLCVFILFFCIGFWRGPFLEPPADPFEHLKRIHSYCGLSSNEMPRENRGLWHYSMASTIICTDSAIFSPESKLQRIDVSHGLFLGMLLSVLFVVAKKGGFVDRWAFIGCLIAFLFMGTNRFSYFSYYSFAPSSTSLFVYWLWIALFFFRRNWQAVVVGIYCAILSLPILWVNHSQEAVFLGFLVVVWLLMNFYFSLSEHFARMSSSKLFNILFFTVLFSGLFLLPQFSFIRNELSSLFVRNLWLENQRVVVTWNGLFLWGKMWSFRVNDTLGNVVVAMAILSIPYLWPRFIRGSIERKVKIFILAILPFLAYCIPLFHFVWLSNVKVTEYYRLCYSSMFWLLFAHFFQGLESHFTLACSRMVNRSQKDD